MTAALPLLDPIGRDEREVECLCGHWNKYFRFLRELWLRGELVPKGRGVCVIPRCNDPDLRSTSPSVCQSGYWMVAFPLET